MEYEVILDENPTNTGFDSEISEKNASPMDLAEVDNLF